MSFQVSARFLSDEAVFFSSHTRQKTRILRVPLELTAVEREICGAKTEAPLPSSDSPHSTQR